MPLIEDPELVARLSMPTDAFLVQLLEIAERFPPQEWTPEAFANGLRYPWKRPGRSYVLRGDDVTLLHELDPAEQEEAVAAFAPDRIPLLAIGSNAAPKNLAIKLAHHEDPADRDVLVLAGELHEVDVVAASALTLYGAMPATLAASPGTAVRGALLLVTPVQLTTLAWGEMPYLLGRLPGAPFVVENGVAGVEVETPLAFVHRFGAFAPAGDPAALEAIPARGRRWDAWTQRGLLDRAAELVLGGDADAETLTRAAFAGWGQVMGRLLPALQEHTRPASALPGFTPVV